jgi:acyl-coenzyme A synthetase/AMP-(fatty) acid ligase
VPREIAIRDELPRSNAGKIFRNELRAGVGGDGN